MIARPLVLVGAGGFGRETAEWAGRGDGFELLGFVDDDPALAGTVIGGRPVLGPSGWLHDHEDVTVAVCAGNPRNPGIRRAIVDRLALPEHRYATLVHPRATVASSASLGPGTVVHAGTVLTADIRVGAHVAIMPAVVLTHDDVVSDFVTIGAGVRLAGGVTVGSAAYIGAGALVREHLSIGPGALVGMGAVVTRDVPAGEVWAGSPARRLHTNETPCPTGPLPPR